jgi:hypothetical protein
MSVREASGCFTRRFLCGRGRARERGSTRHRPLPSAEAEEGNGEGAGARLGRMDKEKVGVRPASTRLDTSGVCGGGPLRAVQSRGVRRR